MVGQIRLQAIGEIHGHPVNAKAAHFFHQNGIKNAPRPHAKPRFSPFFHKRGRDKLCLRREDTRTRPRSVKRYNPSVPYLTPFGGSAKSRKTSVHPQEVPGHAPSTADAECQTGTVQHDQRTAVLIGNAEILLPGFQSKGPYDIAARNTEAAVISSSQDLSFISSPYLSRQNSAVIHGHSVALLFRFQTNEGRDMPPLTSFLAASAPFLRDIYA